MLLALKRNLLAGVRLALFLPVNRYYFRVAPGDFALLVAFNFIAWLAGGVARGGIPGSIDYGALPAALAEVPLLLLASLVIASLYRRRELLLPIALIVIAPDALFEFASAAIALAQDYLGLPAGVQLAIYFGYPLWVMAVLVRSLWVAAGWRAGPFIAGSALLVGLLVVLVDVMPRNELWLPDEDADVESAPQASIAQESLFHAQDGLLAARLRDLKPQRPGVSDLYFVGFAPHGTQDVFERELETVSKIMDTRFDAAGRSLLLSNDPATLAELPVASASNLRAALEGLGKLIDADEDVLFLYITTHGSEQGELSVELPPLELTQIKPAALARILHDSGIKWKVLVISACYSGGFIEPLKDDNTLVITATDAHNQSFGCQNGAEFTWFGKAYFDEALRRTRSFTAAFGLARDAVAERERAQKLSASNPQMVVGPAIAEKLRALEARLAAPAD